MLLFHKFFSDLYNRKCGKIRHDDDANPTYPPKDAKLLEELNRDFTQQEIEDAIKKLQNNKSVSEDLISNEMLKNSSKQLQQLLQKLFNAC